MLIKLLIPLCFLLPVSSILYAQPKADMADSLSAALSKKYLNKADNKISALNKGIENKTLKMLAHLEKQERRIQKKLAKKDSIGAQQLFAAKDRYQSLKAQIKNPLKNTRLNEYIPEFDSLKTSLSFLSQQSSSLTSKVSKQWNDKLKSINTKVADFESRLQQANDIKRIIKKEGNN